MCVRVCVISLPSNCSHPLLSGKTLLIVSTETEPKDEQLGETPSNTNYIICTKRLNATVFSFSFYTFLFFLLLLSFTLASQCCFPAV